MLYSLAILGLLLPLSTHRLLAWPVPVLLGPHKMLSSPPRAGARPSAWVSVKSAAFQEEANFPWRHTMEGALVVFVRLNDRPGLFDSLTSVWQMRTL